jgi:hypothetical protein
MPADRSHSSSQRNSSSLRQSFLKNVLKTSIVRKESGNFLYLDHAFGFDRERIAVGIAWVYWALRPNLYIVSAKHHALPSMMLRIVIRISSSPSAPVCDCAGRPQPRSRIAQAAVARTAAWTFLDSINPIKVLTALTVRSRANDFRSGASFFLGTQAIKGRSPSLFLWHQTGHCNEGNHGNQRSQASHRI